jgi:hypothetical protein
MIGKETDLPRGTDERLPGFARISPYALAGGGALVFAQPEMPVAISQEQRARPGARSSTAVAPIMSSQGTSRSVRSIAVTCTKRPTST